MNDLSWCSFDFCRYLSTVLSHAQRMQGKVHAACFQHPFMPYTSLFAVQTFLSYEIPKSFTYQRNSVRLVDVTHRDLGHLQTYLRTISLSVPIYNVPYHTVNQA